MDHDSSHLHNQKDYCYSKVKQVESAAHIYICCAIIIVAQV